MKRIWVTRAQPGASATAARLAALGYEPVVAPLIETRPREVTIDLTGVAALAFTSAAAVRAYAARAAFRGAGWDLPVFAVGQATAQAAREAGFANVLSADGDATALAALIATQDLTGEILHPGAAELAADLPGVRALAIYDTRPAALPAGFTTQGLDAVLLHSPRAARLLAALPPPPGLTALCLSPAVAEPLTGLGLDVRIAKAPNEEALLALIG